MAEVYKQADKGEERKQGRAETSGESKQEQAGPGQVDKSKGRWILIATILGSSMAFIDSTVVNVALPILQADLKATVSEVQWVVEAYTLFLAALTLVGGAFGDIYGRRKIFLGGIVLFTVASVWCGFAPSIGQLILARAVQGIGGALLTPGSLAIISAAFGPNERGKAIGTWSGFTSITTLFGPVLGGWLVENASWRWVFFINIPLAVVVLAISLRFVPESRDEGKDKRLDWPGVILATFGLGALTYGFIESSNLGLGNPLVLATLAAGAAALVGFVAVEARSSHPMMPLGVFKSRTFSGANLLTLLLYAALGGTLFFLPFNLIQVQGYSPTAAGAANIPFVLLMFGLSRWAGGLVDRYGSKLPLIIGPVLAAAGFAMFALPGLNANYWTGFLPAVLVLGLGMSITVAPLTTTVMGAVDSHRSGLASGINNAVARSAGLLAIAILSLFMLSAFGNNLDKNLGQVAVSTEVRQKLDEQKNRLAAVEIPAEVSPELKPKIKQAVDEAFLSGFRLVMLIGAGMALASAGFAAWLIEGKIKK